MRGRVLIGVLAFWALLSWDAQWHHPWLIGAGVVTALGLAMLVARDEHLGLDDWGPKNTLQLILYLPWLSWQVVLAAGRVMRIAWTPRLIDPSGASKRLIHPRMVEVPCTLRTGTGRVLFANSITLTPGTVTVLTGPDSFTVHALTQADAEGVLDGSMHTRVAKVEG